VPLHLATEDLDAAAPVYSWDPVWDPCAVVGIEVRDAGLHSLSVSERLPIWSVCMGHGQAPRPVTCGKGTPLERSLGEEGWLPNRPGTYTVVMTWVPCCKPKNDASSAESSSDLKSYAEVHPDATVHVVAAHGSGAN
jgi:hypothetical protein